MKQTDTLSWAANYRHTFFDNSVFLHPEISSEHMGIIEYRQPYQLHTDDSISALILFIFMIFVVTLSRNRKYMQKQARELFNPPREYHNLFNDEPLGKEKSITILTGLTLLVMPLLFFSIHQSSLLVYTGIILFYYLSKKLLYHFVNWIFFDKIRNNKWNEAYSYIFSIEGILLFPFLLLSVYFDLSALQIFLFTVSVVILSKIVLIYESYIIFFPKIYGILHLIVYFCALEIAPLLFLCRALACINKSFV